MAALADPGAAEGLEVGVDQVVGVGEGLVVGGEVALAGAEGVEGLDGEDGLFGAEGRRLVAAEAVAFDDAELVVGVVGEDGLAELAEGFAVDLGLQVVGGEERDADRVQAGARAFGDAGRRFDVGRHRARAEQAANRRADRVDQTLGARAALSSPERDPATPVRLRHAP